jgi:hypothetical protein
VGDTKQLIRHLKMVTKVTAVLVLLISILGIHWPNIVGTGGLSSLARNGGVAASEISNNADTATAHYRRRDEDLKVVVPNIVHQIYDYKSPNFFMYLSLMCVQRYLKPDHHYLWVNDAGRFRKGDWENWQYSAKPGSWEADLAELIKNKSIEPMLKSFPISPPGNSSLYATNKAHISDFVRLEALKEYGGIYLDTDAFPIRSMDSLRIHDFTMSYDNIVNPDTHAPKRFCNGVFLSSPASLYLAKWTAAYANFDPVSWDMTSSVVPFKIAVENPDLIHVEWNRLSPISYGFQTSSAAAAMTCGLLDPKQQTVLHPKWDAANKKYTLSDVTPSRTFFDRIDRKMVLHLTMTAVR